MKVMRFNTMASIQQFWHNTQPEKSNERGQKIKLLRPEISFIKIIRHHNMECAEKMAYYFNLNFSSPRV